jgi:hypothetical protein
MWVLAQSPPLDPEDFLAREMTSHTPDPDCGGPANDRCVPAEDMPARGGSADAIVSWPWSLVPARAEHFANGRDDADGTIRRHKDSRRPALMFSTRLGSRTWRDRNGGRGDVEAVNRS